MSGNYTCRATGEEGTETSKPVTVTVTCKLQCFSMESKKLEIDLMRRSMVDTRLEI